MRELDDVSFEDIHNILLLALVVIQKAIFRYLTQTLISGAKKRHYIDIPNATHLVHIMDIID
jgi:hypothetical protein